MITLTISQLAEVTGGRLYGPVNTDAHVSSVTTDSREVTPGALFVAKPGRGPTDTNSLQAPSATAR
ncbi:hypothetical protein ACFODP_00530 [Pseudoglutamicibacter albus]|uniref:hypothetical protein n=1 Tax=Pseudoglutamicibacter albus TaxID=98671 RepID=UPI00360D985A